MILGLAHPATGKLHRTQLLSANIRFTQPRQVRRPVREVQSAPATFIFCTHSVGTWVSMSVGNLCLMYVCAECTTKVTRFREEEVCTDVSGYMFRCCSGGSCSRSKCCRELPKFNGVKWHFLHRLVICTTKQTGFCEIAVT